MSEKERKLSQEEFEKIEAYILGELSPEENAAVESEMAFDNLFKTEVELQKALLAATEVNSFFRSKNLQETSSRAIVKKLAPIKWLVAAGVLLLVGLTAFWFMNRQAEPGEKLYAKFYKADPGLPIAMSSTDNYTFYDGMVSYKEKDYETAIQKWNSISNRSDTLQYYLAMAQLNKGNKAEAKKLLKNPALLGSQSFSEKSIYYLAFIALKDNNINEAKKLLGQIPDFEPGRELLTELVH